MGRIKAPKPGYPDLVHPRELAAARGITVPHYYRLVGLGQAPETCGGIPRKIATAWLQEHAARKLKRKTRKKVAAAAPPSADAPVHLESPGKVQS